VGPAPGIKRTQPTLAGENGRGMGTLKGHTNQDVDHWTEEERVSQ
jgi:hypothetical protein